MAPVPIPVIPEPSPKNADAVIVPVVLTETVDPIPTDTSSSVSTTLPDSSTCVFTNLIDPSSAEPTGACLRIIGLKEESEDSILISVMPPILLAFGSKIIDSVPMVRIPVTLALPTTTRSSANVTAAPVGLICNPKPVENPVVESPCPLVPPPSAPINLPIEESYFKNFPSTFADDLSTSSKNSRRVSPPPPNVESCC